MPILAESDMLSMLAPNRRVFLLEPKYRPTKYPPLGLMKIAAYVRRLGGKVKFGHHYLGEPCDAICVTTLFTYDSAACIQALKQAVTLANGTPVLVGGIYASVLPDHLLGKVPEVYLFKGYSQVLDQEVPEYALKTDADSKWDQYSMVFTSRGCPNNCAYCVVGKIEPDQWVNPYWQDMIMNDRPFIMISDNNLSATSHDHLIKVLRYLGASNKKVTFNGGLDCKRITPELAELLCDIKFEEYGMRMAFDRIAEDGIFQNAVALLKKHTVPYQALMAYVLFNYRDTPKEANYRACECARLKVRAYPQMFQPVTQTSRKLRYIGKYWTARLAAYFRNFWLLAGLPRYSCKGGTFEHWLKTQYMEDVDWAAWHNNK